VRANTAHQLRNLGPERGLDFLSDLPGYWFVAPLPIRQNRLRYADGASEADLGQPKELAKAPNVPSLNPRLLSNLGLQRCGCKRWNIQSAFFPSFCTRKADL
jgi:hypothetical protein